MTFTFPDKEAHARLKFRAKVNPGASITLDPKQLVSFLPMDAIGQDGSLRLDQTTTVAEASTGYTYFEEGDVSIAKITPCFENGKGAVMVNLTGGAGFGTTELIVVRPDEGVDGKFLYYVSQSADFRLPGEAAMQGAGGQKRVPDLYVKDFVVAWPRLEKQLAVADFLDREVMRIDALIGQKRRLSDTLAELRTSILDQLVQGSLEPGVMDGPMDKFHGRIPAGWSVRRLKFLLKSIEQGWSPQAEGRPAKEGEWGVLKAGACNGGVFRPDENKALPSEIEPDPRLEIREGDLLMSRGSGSVDLVGSVAIVKSVRSKLILCDLLYRLEVAEDVGINKDWMVLALNSTALRRQIRLALRGAEGLTRKITTAAIKELTLSLPPLLVQEEIVAKFREADGRRNVSTTLIQLFG